MYELGELINIEISVPVLVHVLNEIDNLIGVVICLIVRKCINNIECIQSIAIEQVDVNAKLKDFLYVISEFGILVLDDAFDELAEFFDSFLLLH